MNYRFTKFFSGLGLFSILCTMPSTTEAVYAGVKSMGRGSAVMATPVDSFIIAYNPAGLAWVNEQLNVGGYWIYQHGRTKVSGNDRRNGTFNSHANSSTFLPEIGACMHYYQCNWTIGVVGYTRDYIKTDYNSTFPQFGTSRLGLEYEHETISPAVAIKFGRYHSIGVSLDLMAQRLRVNGLQNFATPVFSEHPSKVTNKGYDYSFGVGVTVGLLSEFWNCARIAIAWSPAISMQDFKKYKGLLARDGQLHIPERFMVGLAFDIFSNFTVEVDTEHIAWNRIPALDHSIAEFFDAVPFGSDDGVGLGWRDQWIWRIGAEYCSEWYSLRMGYIHARSPIRGSQTFFNALTPDVIENWITAGLSTYDCCIGELSIYAAYGYENRVHGRDSIPDESGRGELNLDEWQANLGITWTKYY